MLRVVFIFLLLVNTAQAQSFYWYDGKTKRQLFLEDKMAYEIDPKSKRASMVFMDKNQKAQALVTLDDPKYIPLFKDHPIFPVWSRGLKGGIIIEFPAHFDQQMVKNLEARYRLSAGKKMNLPRRNFWLFNTGPGFKSLDLANKIRESEPDLISVKPNWLVNRQKK